MPTSPLKQGIAERISLIRYPMIYLIVIAHMPRITGFVDDPNVLTFISSFVTDGLIRLGIPMLTCISGFLIFHKALDLKFALLMRKRFISLITPLLIWNVPLVLVLYVVQSQGLIEHDWVAQRNMYPIDVMNWVNAVFALTDYPINYPMHFLRDLFVLCLLAPIIGILLRNTPSLGLIVLLAIFVPNLDGLLIRNDAMIITFYIGGIAAIKTWDLRCLDRYAVPLICLLLLICSVVVLFDAGRPFWIPLVAPFFVWPASSLFLATKMGKWLINHSRASIFLFMVHGLMLSALSFALPNLYGEQYAFVVWLMVPILVAISVQYAYVILETFMPDFLIILIGGRKSPSDHSVSKAIAALK